MCESKKMPKWSVLKVGPSAQLSDLDPGVFRSNFNNCGLQNENPDIQQEPASLARQA